MDPVIDTTSKLSTLQYPDQLVMTSVVLISKGQPCPTSSGLNECWFRTMLNYVERLSQFCSGYGHVVFMT